MHLYDGEDFHGLACRQFCQCNLCCASTQYTHIIICAFLANFMIPCWFFFFFGVSCTQNIYSNCLLVVVVACWSFFFRLPHNEIIASSSAWMQMHCEKTLIYSKRPNWIYTHTFTNVWFQTWQVRVQQDMSLSQIRTFFEVLYTIVLWLFFFVQQFAARWSLLLLLLIFVFIVFFRIVYNNLSTHSRSLLCHFDFLYVNTLKTKAKAQKPKKKKINNTKNQKGKQH